MKEEQARAEVVRYWMDKAHEAVKAARSEQEAGRFVFALNSEETEDLISQPEDFVKVMECPLKDLAFA